MDKTKDYNDFVVFGFDTTEEQRRQTLDHIRQAEANADTRGDLTFRRRHALSRKPIEGEYTGLSKEATSRLMEAICQYAVQHGCTVNASYHLDELRKNVESPI